MWLCMVEPSRLGESNGRYTMFIICAIDFNVLGPVVVVSVRILVVFACDQGGFCNFHPSESISPRRDM